MAKNLTCQVLLHLALKFHIFNVLDRSLLAAFRICSVWAFKEVHLTLSSFLKTIF